MSDPFSSLRAHLRKVRSAPGYGNVTDLKSISKGLKFGDQIIDDTGKRYRVVNDKGDYIETQVMSPKRSKTLVRIGHDEISSVKRITKKEQQKMLNRFK
jgi:hypothetical protein